MTQKLSIYRFALKYALIVAAIPVLYNTILVVFNLLVEYHGDDPGGPLRVPTYFLILPIMICITLYRYKKINSGFLKLKEALIIGLEISLVTVFIVIAYDILFNTVLAPSFYRDYYQLYGDELFKEFVECCNYTKEEFEHHKNVRLQYWKGYLGDLLFPTFIGLITATIAGLVMRKKNKEVPENNNTD